MGDWVTEGTVPARVLRGRSVQPVGTDMRRTGTTVRRTGHAEHDDTPPRHGT
ncbi:hypothetical protein ACN469_35395 [Corallococcus terminator]